MSLVCGVRRLTLTLVCGVRRLTLLVGLWSQDVDVAIGLWNQDVSVGLWSQDAHGYSKLVFVGGEDWGVVHQAHNVPFPCIHTEGLNQAYQSNLIRVTPSQSYPSLFPAS